MSSHIMIQLDRIPQRLYRRIMAVVDEKNTTQNQLHIEGVSGIWVESDIIVKMLVSDQEENGQLRALLARSLSLMAPMCHTIEEEYNHCNQSYEIDEIREQAKMLGVEVQA